MASTQSAIGWWRDHLELVLTLAGVLLLGAALGWFVVWLGSSGAGG